MDTGLICHPLPRFLIWGRRVISPVLILRIPDAMRLIRTAHAEAVEEKGAGWQDKNHHNACGLPSENF